MFYFVIRFGINHNSFWIALLIKLNFEQNAVLECNPKDYKGFGKEGQDFKGFEKEEQNFKRFGKEEQDFKR